MDKAIESTFLEAFTKGRKLGQQDIGANQTQTDLDRLRQKPENNNAIK